jgi:hypothetical protein
MMTTVLRHAVGDETQFQSGKHLEEDGDALVGELAEVKMSKGEAEKRLNDQTTELNFASGCQVEAIEKEDSLEDQDDLPICREEVQWSTLQKERHPWEKIDEEIENIRRMISRSTTKTYSEEELCRGEPTIAAGKQMQQQQRRNGADGQL